MPKPILRQPQEKTRADTLFDLSRELTLQPQSKQIDKLKMDRLLREKRSKEYMDALNKLDAGGRVNNRKQVEDIINTIKNEFPDVSIEGILLGYVAICYLGKPYEVHTLSITGEIIEHYKAGQSLPGELEKARSIAMRGGYAFIEVYLDCCRAVYPNGSVSVIPC